jgi:hypothetical protein
LGTNEKKKKACEKLQKGMGNNENKRREEATVLFLCLLEYYLIN